MSNISKDAKVSSWIVDSVSNKVAGLPSAKEELKKNVLSLAKDNGYTPEEKEVVKSLKEVESLKTPKDILNYLRDEGWDLPSYKRFCKKHKISIDPKVEDLEWDT